MTENYFTGHIDTTEAQTTASANQNPSQSQSQPPIQEALNNIHINSQQNQQPKLQINEQPQKQHQPLEDDDFVDAKEVIVQPQQVDEQKFIQPNPVLAKQQKQLGNQNYSTGQYSQALVCYRKTLQYTDTQSQEDQKFRSIIYSNIGLTYMKMLTQQSAIEYFKKSLKLNEKYTKARTNLAMCYETTDKIQQALEQYKNVLEITPDDKFVKAKIVPLEIKVQQLQQKRKDEVIGGLKNIGNSILGYFGMSLDNFKLEKGPGGGYNVAYKQ